MPSGMFTYDQFKHARKKMGKNADKEKIVHAIQAQSEDDDDDEEEEEEEKEEEEEDPRPKKKKGSGLDQFARAMAKVKPDKSVKNLQAAQDTEMAEAANHRRDVFRKFPKYNDMVVKGHVNPFQGLDKQTLARDRFRRRMAELMPLAATLGTKGDNQHLKLSTLMQNLRRRHKWGRWRLKAGEAQVWVCNIPGHAYTKNNVEVLSTKTAQPTTAEIKIGVDAAGLEVNSEVPTE
eukprot:gene13280-15689_t